MKKSIILLLIFVVLLFSGCVQKTGEKTAATNNAGTGDNIEGSNNLPVIAENLTTGTETISSEIDSISKELASIDTNDTSIKPLTEADLITD